MVEIAGREIEEASVMIAIIITTLVFQRSVGSLVSFLFFHTYAFAYFFACSLAYSFYQELCSTAATMVRPRWWCSVDGSLFHEYYLLYLARPDFGAVSIDEVAILPGKNGLFIPLLTILALSETGYKYQSSLRRERSTESTPSDIGSQDEVRDCNDTFCLI